MKDSPLRRAFRGLIQLIAGGGLTALVAVLSDGLSTQAATTLLAVSTFIASWAQNVAEDAGWIKPILGTKETPLP